MVEERNENLQAADGKNEQTEAAKNTVENTTQEVEKNEEVVTQKTEEKTEEKTLQLAEEKTVEEVVDEIEKDLATASEVANEKEQTEVVHHDIPFLSYKDFDFNTLLEEAKKLFSGHPVQKIKKHLDEIKAAFDEKVHQTVTAAKEENPDAEVEIPERREFNAFWKDYREKYNAYRKEIQDRLEQNLAIKQELIEELKATIESTELDFNERLKRFKDIQKKWRTSGNVPRAMYSDIWQTFKHHEERFYDLLDLDRDYRDKIFQENLEVKQNIIAKAKDLLTQNDIHHIFKELQNLHLQWKEETGPVAREHRESIWEEFKEVTKQIHDKRREFYKKLKEEFVSNLAKKQEIIAKLQEATAEIPSNHKQWQSKIKEIEKLRESFYQIGYIPKKNRDEIWTAFKDSVKEFNKHKNSFYKSLKELQKENLEKKLNLIKIAEEWKDSEDWKEATQKFKDIQEEWKTVGHVPRKHSEKLWKEFRETCNYYFDRFHQHVRSEKSEEMENFLKKKEHLQALKERFKEVDEDAKYTIDDI
jgi:predicted XRE-type DNA-binding protein